MIKKRIKRIPKSTRKMFPIFLLIATLCMSIGYAAVNSVSLDFLGDIAAKDHDGVFITDIEYVEREDFLPSENIDIYTANKTIVDSKVILEQNSSSNVKLKITVFNSSNEDHVFVGTFFDEEFYDNTNITFDLVGVEIEDIIKAGDYLTFYAIFKFNDTTKVTDNILNSTIDYRFEPYTVKETLSGIEFNYLLKNSVYAPEGDVYEYYSIDENRAVDNTVKIIVFGKTSDYINEVSDLTAEPIDLYRTGSISMYRRTLSDGKFKIYILSDSGKFILNPNAAWMFDKLYSLEDIVNLHLLDTSKVTNMRDMFCDCASLRRVDLSNFKTEKVTNMIGMFARMTVLDYLDLSTFDTSSVTELGQMFTTDPNLKKIYVSDKWNIKASQVADEDGLNVFVDCKSLVGGNGTTYSSSNVHYPMAKIDGGEIGYLTTVNYKLNTGINVNHQIKNKSASEIANWTMTTRFVDTSVKTLTFGQMRDYNDIVSGYNGLPVDSDNSGLISVFRIPNGNMFDVYVLSNSGLFEANADSAWLFDNLVLLEKINNLNMLDTYSVTNMRDMFCDTQTITSLDLSNFNTTNATTFEGMFARMYNITEIDMSNFSTPNLVSIKSMFLHPISSTETHQNYMNAIPKLTTVYVSDKWDISNVANDTVFSNNVNLVGGNGTTFDSSKLTATYARADIEGVEGYFTLK